MRKLNNKIVFGLIIGLAIGIVLSIISILNPLNTWHLKLADSHYSKNDPSNDIVIIAINDESVTDRARQGLGRFNTWSRLNYAQTIENLEDAGVKAIGVDILLTERQDSASQLEINKIIKNPDLIKTYSPLLPNPEDLELAETLEKYNNITLAKAEQDPLDIFQSKIGQILIKPDEDSIARRIPIADSFDLSLAQTFNNQEYEIPLENDQMLVNFHGEPYSFNQVSFIDAYNDNFEHSEVEGKIALIGIMTPTIGDTIATPKGTMHGVEFRANSIQTIIDKNHLKNQHTAFQILTILALAMAVAVSVSMLNIWIALAIALGLTGLYFGYGQARFSGGLIVNMVYPFLTILMAYFAALLWKYFAEIREKKFIKKAFKHYLSPSVMKEVLKNPSLLHLGGMKSEVSVFFSDIANFTTVSEKLSPEELVKMINEYLSVMTKVILKQGGTLDKYVGDAIVAFFGAPVKTKDHAIRACEAALRMRAALPKLNKKWKKESKPEIDFRIGINTGDAIIGNVGSEERFDYTMIGDEVNLGSRLEGANKKYGTNIMISEAVVEACGDKFVVRELDLIKVKGKNKPVRVYELLGHTGKFAKAGIKLVEGYNKGLAYYKNRDFLQGMKAFDEVLTTYPGDEPTKIYRQRCDVLSQYPPKPNWDGIFTMHEK